MRNSRTPAFRLLWVLACALLVMGLGTGLAPSRLSAQEAQVERVEREIKPLTEELDQIKGRLERLDLPAGELNQLRGQIERIRTQTLQLGEALTQPTAAATQSVEQLGAPPAEGAAEDPAIAEQRKQLTARRDALRSAAAKVDLARLTAEQLAQLASSKIGRAHV